MLQVAIYKTLSGRPGHTEVDVLRVEAAISTF